MFSHTVCMYVCVCVCGPHHRPHACTCSLARAASPTSLTAYSSCSRGACEPHPHLAATPADGELGEGGGRAKFGEAKHGEREWENDVARNILQLYRADVHTQAQQLAQEEAERAEAAAQAALDAASPGARRSNLVAVSAPKYEPRRRRSSLPKITATSLDKPSTAQDVLPRPGKPVDPTMTGTSRPLKRVLRLVPKPKRDSDSGTFV